MASICNKENLFIVFSLVLTVSLALAQDSSSGGMSWDSAKSIIQTGLANSGSMLADNDPTKVNSLRRSIGQATALIQEYRQNGLSKMPNIPQIPYVSTLASLPDKLIRAELSMLQDEIKMVQEMMENPLSGTMNIPTNLANMFSRIGQQLSQ